MKTLLLILFFSPLFCIAQKIVLIDRNFYHPVILADSFSIEQASRGLLPVYQKDLQAVNRQMQWLIKHIISPNEINTEESIVLKMGSSNCIVTTEKNRRIGGKYTIVLNTEIDNLKTSIVLASGEPNKRALQRVSIFMDYLNNNSSLL